MKNIFFTPGPTQLYPTVARHLQKAIKEDIASISHRGEKFHEIYDDTQNALRKLLKIPKDFQIFLLSSGTEAMERIIENTVGESSLHLVGGEFSKRFYETANFLHKKAEKVEVAPGLGFDFGQIDIGRQVELVCFTHNETSTGVALPMNEIYGIKKRFPDKLIALDTVSSSPYVDVDFGYVDLCFFSVQKGFGLPAGLGIVIVSPTAMKINESLERKNYMVGTYHSFGELLKYSEKFETPETPNVLAIYLLGKVAQDMLKIGIQKIRKNTKEKADLLYNFFEKQEGFRPFVKEKKYRSNTVIVVETDNDSSVFIEKLKKRGLVVGNGYKDFKNKQLRIANFPAHSTTDVKRLIREIKNI
ncbi:alanine--glyoxylate aminotransferase family protein [Candidatus Gottesmanbacteria bacterium]|nr:alanine--glyoxylate aminotransferase family protein [Candidatus Gottesmanbacteria bacterium]